MHRYYIFFFVSRALALTLWEIFGYFFFHVQRRYPGLSNAILTFEKFPKNLEIF